MKIGSKLDKQWYITAVTVMQALKITELKLYKLWWLILTNIMLSETNQTEINTCSSLILLSKGVFFVVVILCILFSFQTNVPCLWNAC